MKKITALVNTKLKKKPVDSSELSPGEFMAVAKQKYYFVADEEPEGSHTKVVLGFGAGTWYVFDDDWDGLINPDLTELDQNDIIGSICRCADSFGLTLNTQKAYILATVQHETANTYQPVREAYWKSEQWREDNLRYFPFYGRGYVQLTWEFNYQAYSQLLGVDLVNQPDLALKPDLALYILCHGFKHGTFTGRKLEHYIRRNKTDFFNARRCINGIDRQREIAKLAKKHLEKLQAR